MELLPNNLFYIITDSTFLDNLLKSQDISSLITDDYDFTALKRALNIVDDGGLLPEVSSPEGKKKALMLMLLLWEKQTDQPTKHALLNSLKTDGCYSIARKLEILITELNYNS